ncbi:MAG: hypothetical protein K2F63_04935 [Muribaculaceae bacterium]|nr:hypothetical protein [Muribaculaceae bacterium]
MNKKIIVAGMIALSALFTPAAFAQQPSCDSNPVQCKLPRNEARKTPNPFEGLNLSADQQARLDALKKENQAKRKADCQQKADKKRQACDEAKAARADQLAKIKEILTPEQYVAFLENNYLSRPDFRKKAQRGDRMAKAAVQRKAPRNASARSGQLQEQPASSDASR